MLVEWRSRPVGATKEALTYQKKEKPYTLEGAMKENFQKLKEKNKHLLLKDMREKRRILKAYPYFVSLATDWRCNLNCIMCFRKLYGSYTLQNKPALDEKLFIKFADEVFPAAEVLQLNIVGEPLISRNIDLELEYALKYDVKLDISTNGMLLDSAYKNINKLLNQAQSVTFSFDSPFKETYESIRIGADYNRVVDNMRFFQAYRQSLPRHKRPAFTICMVLMKSNLKEVLPMIEFAKKIGAGHLSIAHMAVFTEEMKGEGLNDIKEATNFILKKAAETAHKNNLSFSAPPLYTIEKEPIKEAAGREIRINTHRLEKIKNACPFLWERVYIDMNANIIACCSPKPPVMGNIKESSFAEIWNGEKYQEMRQAFTGGKPNPLCSECCKTGFLSYTKLNLSYFKNAFYLYIYQALRRIAKWLLNR